MLGDSRLFSILFRLSLTSMPGISLIREVRACVLEALANFGKIATNVKNLTKNLQILTEKLRFENGAKECIV